MFSADLKYNYQTNENAIKARDKLAESAKAEDGFSFEFVAEENSVIVKIKATSSELLKKAMYVIFPIIEQIDPELKSE